jgi:pyridoxamine 5'-phosphate oxidase
MIYHNTMASIADLRREYTRHGLTEESLEKNPFAQFRIWFDQAVAAGLADANAMTLATADAAGFPSARIVLLKGFDEGGFVFFTNYSSAKGKELKENPRAALVFFWPELERQVRVAGDVTLTTREESETYFHSRPRESQIGALVSHQGTVISGRPELERRLAEVERECAGKEVPLPDYWGGYRLQPRYVEFWQGRPGRLHDRLRFTREAEKRWKVERLCP